MERLVAKLLAYACLAGLTLLLAPHSEGAMPAETAVYVEWTTWVFGHGKCQWGAVTLTRISADQWTYVAAPGVCDFCPPVHGQGTAQGSVEEGFLADKFTISPPLEELLNQADVHWTEGCYAPRALYARA